MSVGDSQEHDELREVVREFLRQRSPSGAVRRLIEAGEGRDDEVDAGCSMTREGGGGRTTIGSAGGAGGGGA